MPALSIVIPALNEVRNLEAVIASVPTKALAVAGWSTEILVVDNASVDGTGEEARRLGARVVFEPRRGYGNAYKAGFAQARGDYIITGDADRTYPLDHALPLLEHLIDNDLDFLSTNRLHRGNRATLKRSHAVGNTVLSLVSRGLFRNDFADSQSGMWVFRSLIWRHLDVRSRGMAFSQELKNEACRAGFRCGEVPIEYRARHGEVKLNAARDGVRNLSQLFAHRVRRPGPAPLTVAVPGHPRQGRTGAVPDRPTPHVLPATSRPGYVDASA
jgi:glycosyltransferase involved in cell wall biosynthesis